MSSIAEERPRFSAETALRHLEELYGVSGSASELPSERDQNFLVEDRSGRRFVLKIASSAERGEILDLQNSALEHLAVRAPAYRFPRPVASRSGQRIASLGGSAGRRHFARLLSYIPGRPLADVRPHSSELLRNLGRLFGCVDLAFQDFDHPAASRDLIWDMGAAGRVIRRHLPCIRGDRHRALVETCLAEFEACALPRLPELETAIIHNDGNDHNVLVGWPERKAGTLREPSVLGVVDFGDMLRSYAVCDLAIAAAYAILDKRDPLGAACEVAAGYDEMRPLVDVEFEILPALIAARLATSVAVSAFQQSQEPDNRYLSVSEEPAWEALDRLAHAHPRHATYALRSACGRTPCPRSVRVVTWLVENRGDFAPVVDARLCPPEASVVDLSAGSLALGQVAVLEDPSAFSRWVESEIAEAGARIGIGRYDEGRLAYAGPQYRMERDGFRDSRTIHIGIDLFAPPGTPVYAPLPGVVHSFQNNDRRYDYGPTIILEHETGGEAGPFFTLYGHLSLESLEGLAKGKGIRRGERIGWLGDMRVNGNWPPHLHFQIIADLLGRAGDFPGVVSPRERTLWLGVCPDPNLILGIPDAILRPGARSAEEILRVRREHLSGALSVSYRKPLHIVRGYMQHLYDADGQPYLDAVNNVSHVGHCHPRVVREVQRQTAVLNTNTRYLHANLALYAERLCAKLPEPLRVCFFVNSGSEANDLALRLARTHTRRQDIVVLEGAYHGNLTSLIEISPYKFDGPGGSGAPRHVHKVPVPDTYRGLYRAGTPDVAVQYSRHVSAAIEAARAAGRGVGAFICESILSCAGQIVLPPGYLEAAYRRVREAGGVCIADEVQVGFGRVGSHFWAFDTQGVVPDIVTMGKPIGNGHPLGAVVTTGAIAASFVTGMEYFNTFGGNPVSCAAGHAVLDVIEEEALQARAAAVGAHFRKGLGEVARRHAKIGDVRGLGLFLGVELVRNRDTLEPAGEEASLAAERMKDHGILVGIDGPFRNVLKIKPPLCFAESDADRFVETLDSVLGEDTVRTRPR